MKKLLIIALVLSLSACQKKTCWTCVINTVLPRTTPNGPNNNIIYSDVCDKTKSDIREFEKANTYVRGTTSQTVSCSKK